MTQPQANFQAVFSVDLEDWYQGIEQPIATWGQYERRTMKGLAPLLDLLDKTDTKATFFTLGYIAKTEPEIIREVARRGHELASHGFSHEKVYNLSHDAFRQEVRESKSRLEDLSGQVVTAYRAPYFTITDKSLWALNILREEGYTVDASISPVKTWRYGIEACPDEIYFLEDVELVEFPSSHFKFLNKRLNIGGAYFRIFPYSLTRNGIRKRLAEGKPVMFYVHPWEYDPDHPRLKLEWKARLTHYSRLRRMLPNTERLLRDFRFTTLSQYLNQHGTGPGQTLPRLRSDVLQAG